MHLMSDPKTSPNSLVTVQDRLYVAGNASFICFIVSIVWTVLFVGKAQFSISTLVLLAAPLVATGTTVLIGTIFKDLVPKSTFSAPLNLTVPIIWCLVCYLGVILIATQETGSTRVPDPLLPALVWSKLSNLVPVLVSQVVALSLALLLSKEKA